jgi:hypothetical protein
LPRYFWFGAVAVTRPFTIAVMVNGALAVSGRR